MKNRASVFLKQLVSVIVSVVKAKSVAVKSKTNAMKTRLIIFGLLRNKKVLMSTISHKIHALMGQEKDGDGEGVGNDDNNKAIVLYNAVASEASHAEWVEGLQEEEEDKDLDCDEDGGLVDDGHGSVVDLVRNSRCDGSDFNLENEIDHVADVFIRRFHNQMRMQKQDSFKRYEEMLQRSIY